MPPLTRDQHYQIECDLRAGFSQTLIAHRLSRSLCTIQPEIARYGTAQLYTADRAVEHQWRCAAKSAANQVTKPQSLWRQVNAALLKRHSPAQIAHVIGLTVSMAAIYRYVHRCGKPRLKARLRHYTAARQNGVGQKGATHQEARYGGPHPRHSGSSGGR